MLIEHKHRKNFKLTQFQCFSSIATHSSEQHSKVIRQIAHERSFSLSIWLSLLWLWLSATPESCHLSVQPLDSLCKYYSIWAQNIQNRNIGTSADLDGQLECGSIEKVGYYQVNMRKHTNTSRNRPTELQLAPIYRKVSQVILVDSGATCDKLWAALVQVKYLPG